MCKFIHLRVMHNENNGDDSYISGKGGKTIAFEVLPHPDNDNRSLIKYAVAICKSSENFNRRIARDVSSGRLIKGKESYLVVEDGDSIYEALVEAVNHV